MNIKKLALFYPMDLRSHSQILARTEAQANYYRSQGVDTICYSFARGYSGKLPSGHRLINSNGISQAKYFADMRQLRGALTEFQPDAVVMRYSFATKSILKIAHDWPVFLEIHTDDQTERDTKGLKGLAVGYQMRRYRSALLSACAGGVFVSTELSNFNSYSELTARTVVTNGIEVPSSALPAAHNTRPVVGYAIGFDAPWQGVDRFVDLARRLPQFDFRLLTSVTSVDLGRDIPQNVSLIRTAKQDEYREQLASLDVALGTLALDRKGLTMSASLKVRESVAYGIPTFLFSKDEDLSDAISPLIQTSLTMPDNPEQAAQDLKEFTLLSKSKRLDDEHRYVVDIEGKAAKYLDFLNRHTSLRGGYQGA